MYFYAIEISVVFCIYYKVGFLYCIKTSYATLVHYFELSLYSNMLSHWYLHLIAFFFLHYSWVASYRNFLLNYLYFSSVNFFTIEQNIFLTCMQQFSKLRRFLFWNAPSKLSDFNTHRANNKIKRLKGSLRCKPRESTRMIMLTNCARCLEYFQVEKRCQHSTIPIINFHKEFFFSGWK